MELLTIKREQIIEGSRFREEYGDIRELAISMKKEGIIQPLAVRENGDGTYQLVAGGRRFKAAAEAGIEDIPVRVYPQDISELQMRTIELMENIARKDLTWWEAAKLKQQIHRLQVQIHGEKKSTSPDAPGWSKAMTAELLGVAESTVVEDIKLAENIDLMPDLKKAKNRADAKKAVKNLEEAIILKELASRIEAKTATTGLETRQQEICNRYMVEDFFEGVRRVPDGTVDIVELDPPYGIFLQDQKAGIKNGAYNGDNYNEVDASDYLQFMAEVFSQCYRVMAENSWLICWFGPDPWFEPMASMVEQAGFSVKRIPGIWAKPTGQTLSPQTNLANSYEMFFYARKGSPIISKQGRSNIFHFKGINPQLKVHPTERPIEMIQEVLATFGWQGARVLIPFLGSGNTILAAENLNMTALGFELTRAYKDPFVLKANTSAPGQYKSYKGGDDVPF